MLPGYVERCARRRFFVRGDAGGTRLARPVGVAFGPDGALYFTSDGGVLKGLFRLKRM